MDAQLRRFLFRPILRLLGEPKFYTNIASVRKQSNVKLGKPKVGWLMGFFVVLTFMLRDHAIG